MASFNLKQACTFRLKRIEEISEAGQTQVTNTQTPEGEDKQTQVTQ
jgi:hypothetical protein